MKRFNSYKNYLKLYCVAFLLFQLIRAFNGLLISQLGQPFIHIPRVDPLIWTLIASGIPDLIVQSSFLSLALDVIVVLPVLIILLKNNKAPQWTRPLIGLHILIFSFYLLIIFSFPTLSIRKYLGLVIVPFVFLAGSDKRYFKNLELLRYYVLFIFSSSAIWKISRGALFDSEQFYNIMRAQHFDHIINFASHISSQVGLFFIEHPGLAQFFYWQVTLIQLSFIIGAFTKKYDHFLLAGFLLFIVGDFLVMRIEYWEFFIFIPIFFLTVKSNHSGV